MTQLRELGSTIVESGRRFGQDKCPRLAAALSYYTIFSLPPLLMIVLALLGVLYDPADVRTHVREQVERVVGAKAADQIVGMIASADESGAGGVAGAIGIAVLLLGATAVMAQLQDAMNKVWEVQPDPEQGGVKNFLLKRVLSFGMILGIAFLLLVSLVITTVISSLSDFISDSLGGNFWGPVFQVVNFVVSIAIITVLIAAMFKFLPDAKVQWRSVWVGAALTAVLFTLGKFALGLYLGRKDLGSVYGAAGSLALILLWVYFSGMIFFFGAEFTQVWSRKHGHGIVPDSGAVRVVEKIERVDEPETASARET